MKDRIFWKVIAVGIVLGLFAIAFGLCGNSHMPSLSTAAYAADATGKPSLPLKFENLNGEISRAKVAGGWLVKISKESNIAGSGPGGQGGGSVESVSITFYPDPQHTWDGGGLK